MQKPCVHVREDHTHNRDLPLSKQIKGKSEFFNTGCVPANQKDKRNFFFFSKPHRPGKHRVQRNFLKSGLRRFGSQLRIQKRTELFIWLCRAVAQNRDCAAFFHV